MPVWNFVLNNICFSMDGISVSWLFVSTMLAPFCVIFWFKSRKKGE